MLWSTKISKRTLLDAQKGDFPLFTQTPEVKIGLLLFPFYSTLKDTIMVKKTCKRQLRRSLYMPKAFLTQEIASKPVKTGRKVTGLCHFQVVT